MGSPHVLPNGQPGLSLRMGKMKAGPVVSDNGNFIIDAPFAEELMRQPEEVRASLWSFFFLPCLLDIQLTRNISALLFLTLAVAQDQNVDRCRRSRTFLWHGQGCVLW